MRTSLLFVLVLLVGSACRADLITNSDVVSLSSITGSGNGTLDLRLMSGSTAANSSGSYNADDANTNMPNGSGTSTFAESYITSVAEIRSFYNLNFPSTIKEIVLFLDLVEQGNATETNNNFLTKVDVIVLTPPPGVWPNPIGADLSSATQNAINQANYGGVTLANLQPASINVVGGAGAGREDYAIFTGIDPFSASLDGKVLQFNISMTGLSGGSEEVFLSGKIAGTDIRQVPEPAAALLVGVAGLAVWFGNSWQRRRTNTVVEGQV